VTGPLLAGLVIGLAVGAFFGVVTMGALLASRRREEP